MKNTYSISFVHNWSEEDEYYTFETDFNPFDLCDDHLNELIEMLERASESLKEHRKERKTYVTEI